MTTPQEALEALEALGRQFREQLPGRLEALKQHLDALSPNELSPEVQLSDASRRAELESLHTLSHRLTGTAGTFGMPGLSQSARRMEKLVLDELKETAPPTPARQKALERALGNLFAVARQSLSSASQSLPVPAPPSAASSQPLLFLLEDDALQLAHMAQALEDSGYRTRGFAQTEDFRQALTDPHAESPEAVILDMVLEDGALQGAELIQELGLGGSAGIPVVVISVRDDLEAKLAALRAGARRYLTKPVNLANLSDLLDALLGREPYTPYRVLLVDDDPLLLESQSLVLESAGMQVLSLAEPMKLLEAMAQWSPEVVVLDVHMPEVSGPELAAVLREGDNHLELPILFLSAETDLQQQLQALSLGGDDFLVKPVLPEHFIEAVSVRARRSRQLVTMRKRLESSLYERKREHMAVNHHAIVSVTDNRGQIIAANNLFCQISGYSRQELLGQNHRILKSDVHPPEFYRQLWLTISSGRVWKGEICNRSKEGRDYWVESTITPFLDDTGKPYQYISIRTDITRLKQAEQALNQRERELVTTLDATQDGILSVTPDRRVSFANEQFWTLWGLPVPTYHLGRDEREHLRMMQHKVKRTEEGNFLDHLDRLYQNQDTLNDTVELLDGRFLEVYSQAVIGGDTNAIGRVWSFHDITESRRAQAEIERYQERLRLAQMYANIGSWEWNIQSGELYWTEQVAPLLGYPEGEETEASFDNFMQAVHPEDRDILNEAIRVAVEDAAPYECEFRVVWPDGRVRRLLAQGAVLHDEKGDALQMLGVVQDITERVEADRALRESQERFIFAVEGAGDGVWDWDIPRNVTHYSRLYSEMLGYPPEEFSLDGQALQRHIHPDDLPLIQERVNGFLENRRNTYKIEVRLRCKDGRYKWILCRSTVAARDIEGKPIRVIGIHSDIDARKEAEAALIRAREEADRANRAKSEFLSNMSHELRTPLNAIIGFAQILEYEEGLGVDQQDSVAEILKAGHHLLVLINEVLDLAKVESGRMDLFLEPVSVAKVVEECLGLVRGQAAKRGIQISTEGLEGAVVQADRTRLKQVLLNLLSNAVKYNREAGQVKVGSIPLGEMRLQIQVTDTGMGIAPEDHAALFQPFNRLAAEGTAIEGTGIGLSIARRLTELMDGHLEVESELGVGSCFSIELPNELHRPPSEMSETQTAASEPDGHHAQQAVLYIEDNPANLLVVEKLLRGRSHIRLFTAEVAEQGIAMARDQRPALILLDINLPGLNGFEVLEILRNDPMNRGVPIVAVSAITMPDDIKRARRAGFDDYLTKPLDEVAFLETVDAHLKPDGPTREALD
ncbi:response regulator [Halomonas aquatica]|uniref:histidine kinase n=1 Tax=Halomonas aquatica TaxID=3151123 RepID=A0ABV1NBD4_9GAMM